MGFLNYWYMFNIIIQSQKNPQILKFNSKQSDPSFVENYQIKSQTTNSIFKDWPYH